MRNRQAGIAKEWAIDALGMPRFPSPVRAHLFVSDRERVLHDTSLCKVRSILASGVEPPTFERAGPRETIFFDPSQVKAAMVTCGGLCPGLNDVIRALVMGLWYSYGVRDIWGLRYGYQGLVGSYGHQPMLLNPEVVDHIHEQGGTILGSSRGPQPVAESVEFLVSNGISMLFTVGGDGTQRGAMAIVEEIKRRKLAISVIGVPKTIDNDIRMVEKTFGFETAVATARDAIRSAHAEAKGVPYGVGLVKLMGRESGFIAAYSALANSEVNLALIPEDSFVLHGKEGVCEFLRERLVRRRHAVVVVAEGSGQGLLADACSKEPGTDLSGNRKLKDIGLFLMDELKAYFKEVGLPVGFKYLDPSYVIRSLPAIANDSVFCLQLAHHAVHAAMAGKTGMIVGLWNGQFTHVPMAAAVGCRKTIDPDGMLWQSVIHTTGQPRYLRSVEKSEESRPRNTPNATHCQPLGSQE